MNKLTLIFLLFIGFTVFSQEKLEKNELSEIFDLARESEGKGDFGEALEILERVNKNDSAFCSVLVSKSYYYIQLEKYEEAIEQIDKAFSLECMDSKMFLYLNKSAALSNLKREEEALEVYNEGLKIFPKSHKLWNNKALTLVEIDRIDEAIVAYKTAILLNPMYREPHLQLGNICYKQGKMTQALMCYDMYLLLEPDASNGLNALQYFNDVVSKKMKIFLMMK